MYVLGKGRGTFCYRVEYYLDCFGTIKGSPAYRYGIYYGKTQKNSEKRY